MHQLHNHNNSKSNVSTLHNAIPLGHTLANSHSTAWKGSSKNCGLQPKNKNYSNFNNKTYEYMHSIYLLPEKGE